MLSLLVFPGSSSVSTLDHGSLPVVRVNSFSYSASPTLTFPGGHPALEQFQAANWVVCPVPGRPVFPSRFSTTPPLPVSHVVGGAIAGSAVSVSVPQARNGTLSPSTIAALLL